MPSSSREGDMRCGVGGENGDGGGARRMGGGQCGGPCGEGEGGYVGRGGDGRGEGVLGGPSGGGVSGGDGLGGGGAQTLTFGQAFENFIEVAELSGEQKAFEMCTVTLLEHSAVI
eukprot:CAMPEP_0181213276 /NCGR_PEP_ID=MMETSP1096-20121128/24814_1 /TAXON_ID=156174 ORGANISM="Chrysochromulina ericina, Strain CCMP281" /NCGR_SAMPLE_ID=MMETSP1096 /ASSEMBLY_ACC=CAM_ASM_000453 /LENGTH=114 /DNA_ID=CAMNT_0023304895 /DNA_START=648 /DNA_END=991 /DNA_ORIENTATION=-